MTKLTIDPGIHRQSSLDAHHIYNQAISQLIEMSSEIWSDYNRHDPGITILEILSYLLTELSYRTDWNIADILVDGLDNNAQKQSVMQKHFPSADKVLPAAPLTENDYRKLLTDLPDVQNAWIEPQPVNLYLDCNTGVVTLRKKQGEFIKTLTVSGGYRVKVELADQLSTAQKTDVMHNIEAVLNTQRNLCEWFNPPKPVSKQGFILCGDIEINPKADPHKVFADVMLAVHQHLQEPVVSLTPEQSLTSHNWADEVFNGPLTEHGYISDRNINNAGLKTKIRLSDIINLIMKIEDVVAVRHLIINPEGQDVSLETKWTVAVSNGRKAVLKPQGGQLSFFKHQIPAFYSKEEALTLLKNKIKQAQKLQEQPVTYSIEAQSGINREIKNYQSIQTDLPEVYGLSEAGLPPGSSDLRKAQVLQLRGFLTFFDQIAANLLSQTHHLRDLLSPDADQENSYFGQIPETITDREKLYADSLQETGLSELLSDRETDLERRNRFMDFLLARFGEDMTGLTDIMLNAFSQSPAATLSYKANFYKAIPEVSRDRGLGHNTGLKAFWNTDNVSGLEKRLCYLLGIDNHKRRNLSSNQEGMYLIEHSLLLPNFDNEPALPVCMKPGCDDCIDPYSYQIHIILPAYGARFSDMDFRHYCESVIRAEVPAHIMPKICWIDKEQMVALEKAYKDWLAVLHGASDAEPEAIKQKLIDILGKLNNVYPVEQLHDCKSEQTGFVLGRTALGSFKESS